MHSYTHSYTDGGVSRARLRPAHREQLGLGGVLLRDTGDRANNLPFSPQTAALPPELLLPLFNTFSFHNEVKRIELTNGSSLETKFECFQRQGLIFIKEMF